MAIFPWKYDYRHSKVSLNPNFTDVRVCVISGQRVKGHKNDLNGLQNRKKNFGQFFFINELRIDIHLALCRTIPDTSHRFDFEYK